jgi:outer membrane protein OmpA-like peptidoglycan-associated protein/tetratricopeptide (TPR) repeat protein
VTRLTGTILLSLFFSSVFPQSVSSLLTKARDKVQRGEYYLAAEDYLAALKKDSLNYKANLEYGLLNTQYINNPGNAGPYLLRAERMSKKDTLSELILGLAQYYQSQNMYAQALLYYRRLGNRIEKNNDGKIIEAVIRRDIVDCQYAVSSPVQPVYKRLRVTNAGNGVNTIYPEYAPVVSENESLLMFTSRRKEHSGQKIDVNDGNYFEDMYLARKENGVFKNAHPFSASDPEVKAMPNTPGHDAMVSISPRDNKLYTCDNGKLYESEWKNNSWTTPTLMPNPVNVSDGFQSHASLSADGKTLYFSSEREHGLGGLDIYRCDKKSDGSWGDAINLGPLVNTKENDDSPFIGADDKTLYFSSKGHPGYGEYDLFTTTWNGSSWNAPQNMGEPFSSSGNDIHLSISTNGAHGYFASSRAGGFGDMDIYEVTWIQPFQEFVVDPESRISMKIPDTVYVNEPSTFGVVSSKLSPSQFASYYWQVGDSILPAHSELVTYTFTKTGNARIRLQGELKSGDLVGYEKNVVISSRPEVVAGNDAQKDTSLRNLPALESVYFEYNKFTLDEDAKAALGRVAETIKAHKRAVEIAAYADSRGTNEYNLRLTQKRAQAVAAFMRSKSVKVKRASGLGEKDPLNNCVDGVTCTENEYKINRRAEIRWAEIK